MDQDAIILFRELAGRPLSEREEYYARHQVPAAVRVEVESLLRFDRETVDSIHGYVAAAAKGLLLRDPLVPGARLGPYEVLAAVGAGGMGAVYKARDTRLDRTVAIKVLPPDVAGDPALNQRFEREDWTCKPIRRCGTPAPASSSSTSGRSTSGTRGPHPSR